jgi:hypothetical protein
LIGHSREACCGVPISIRLDDDVRDELEVQAHSQGIGLETLLRDLATRGVREAARKRIQEASETVAHHVAGSAERRRDGRSIRTGARRATRQG